MNSSQENCTEPPDEGQRGYQQAVYPGQPQFVPYQQMSYGQYGGPPQAYPQQQQVPAPESQPQPYPAQGQGQGQDPQAPTPWYPPQPYPQQYQQQPLAPGQYAQSTQPYQQQSYSSQPQPPFQQQQQPSPGQYAGQQPPARQQPYPQAQLPYHQQQQQQQQHSPSGSNQDSVPTQEPQEPPPAQSQDKKQQQIAPEPPSVGYVPGQKASGDFSKEAEALRKAMKGRGTDENTLINVLSAAEPLELASIRHSYLHRFGRDLEADLKSETSQAFEMALVSLAVGPLGMDVRHLKRAMAGPGTHKGALHDILLCRSNSDIRAIKAEYAETYKVSLETALKSDLSGNARELFLMLLEAKRPEPGTPFDQQSVDADARRLRATLKRHEDKDQIEACSIFMSCTDEKLLAIYAAYTRLYNKSMSKKISKKFSGDVQTALIAMLLRAKNPAFEIATRLHWDLEVRINRWVYWIIKMHWDPSLFAAVKEEFHDEYGVSMPQQVLRSILETRSLVALVSEDKHLRTLLRRLLPVA